MNFKFSQWIMLYFSFIGVSLFLLIGFIGCMVALGVSNFKVEAPTSRVFSKKIDKIGVVELSGVITDSKDVVEKLHWAYENKQIKGIIVRVDSPGGSVGPSQEIYEEISRIVESKTKPLYVSMANLAASGGYYVSIPAQKICSSPGSITGSIGVYMQFMDFSKVFEWMKVHPSFIKAGKYKTAGNVFKPMNEEEKGLYQATVESTHTQFIQALETHRGAIIKKKYEGKNLIDLAQGQIFNGKQAYDVGLVDELGGLWSCARLLHKELKLKGETPKLHYVELDKEFRWKEFLEKIQDVSALFSGMVEYFKGHPGLFY